MSTAREAAAKALMGVFAGGGYSNLVLDGALGRAELSPRDKAFCSALFYGVVERCITLDWAIAAYSSVPLKKMDDTVLQILRCAFYQLLYMPSVPQSAAVNEAVELCRKLGKGKTSGFVNGVLRSFLRADKAMPRPKDKLRASEVHYSIPGPLIQLWRKGYGETTAHTILEGTLTKAPLFIRVNTCKTSPTQLTKLLTEAGVKVLPCHESANALILEEAGSITGLPGFAQGLFHVQDLASQLCAQALDARPGMRVLDVCAAPGGKSFTAAQTMENTGEVVALDLYDHRAGLIAEGASRLGLSCIHASVGDATVYDPNRGEFDRVLCDVVCSGFGILRRKPEIRYKPLKSIDGIWQIQYNILNTSSHYCKKGGRLIYSTCTLNPQENQEVVNQFLAEHPQFALVEETTRLPGQGGSDGFFFAVLQRKP